MSGQFNKFLLVFGDGSVAYSEIKEGKEQLTFAQLEKTHGPFTARPCEPKDFPQDRSYRGAWRLIGDQIKHDMDAAREIHRDKIREARAPLLAAQDVALLRAIEEGKPTAPIAAEKQRLRDATAHPSIDAAQSVDELKKAWPL